ncbi:MAG: ACT domain-containing protein [Spirochaetaceae bacterium]|nr:MAG: ACT domain-containing protein [Spirochaetaceae bacterium]
MPHLAGRMRRLSASELAKRVAYGILTVMSALLVLSASGRDRVGIVDDLSAALLDLHANIEESRMALLGGEFAMILLVSCADEQTDALVDALPEIAERCGLDISVRPTHAPEVSGRGRPYRVECVSLDTPGIVHAVTALLRRRNVNIDDLETDTTGAPFTGAPMFRMRIVCEVPEDQNASQLRRDLDEIALAHDLDISFRPLGTVGEE